MADQESNEWKCVSCGFLAKYSPFANVPPPKYFEVDEEGRRTGRVDKITAEVFQGPVDCKLRCYRKVDIEGEYQQKLNEIQDPKEAALAVLNKNRQCKFWYQYTPGFSPKENLEELRSAELEESRKRFEQQMERDRREFELKLDKKGRNLTLWVTLVVLIFAGIEIYGTFRPVFTEKIEELLGVLANNISELTETIKRFWNPPSEPPTRHL